MDKTLANKIRALINMLIASSPRPVLNLMPRTFNQEHTVLILFLKINALMESMGYAWPGSTVTWILTILVSNTLLVHRCS